MGLESSEAFAVFVIDSRSFVREALCEIISREFTCTVFGLNEVAEIAQYEKHLNDVSLAIYCCGAKPLETLRNELGTLKAQSNQLRVVLLADDISGVDIGYLSGSDIQGIIPSSYTSDQVSACLKAVTTGVSYFPEPSRTEEIPAEKSGGRKNNLHPDVCDKLTPRQIQIMELLTVGRSNKYIASELGLRENTVKVHVHDAMKRLGATSRTHASHLLLNGYSDPVGND